MKSTYDAIVVGGGAAGLNAALVLGRSCRSVLLCDDGRPRNAVADRMHGFLTRDGTPPHELLRIAREELERYASVEKIEAHVDSIERTGDVFAVTAGETPISARAVLLATGVYDALPAIDGVRERWGRGVFVCPYCDGWEFRNARIAVLHRGRKAVELAQELHQWTSDVVVCANGGNDLTQSDRRWLRATESPLRLEVLTRVSGGYGSPLRLEFEGGSDETCAALFLGAPLRQRSPLAEMLGCSIRSDGEIEIDARGRTGVPGVYAAGDAVTVVHQVILAAASGVCAAMTLNEDLLRQEVEATVRRIP